MSKRKKIDSLQTIRALAFLGIFTVHSGVSPLGYWGVSVFLVLSGFLMMYAYHNKTLQTSIHDSFGFSVKKISSLYPLHIIVLIVAILLEVQVLLSDFSVKQVIVDFGKAVLNVFLLQSWIPSEAIFFSYNGVAWYLSDCLFLYACFPFILKAMKNLTVRKALVLSAVIYIIQVITAYASQFVHIPISYIDNFPKWFTYIFPVFRLGDFIIGACFGFIYVQTDLKLRESTATVLECITIAIIILLHNTYLMQNTFLGADWFQYSIRFTLTSVALILLFAINKGWISRTLTCKPLLYIAGISAYTFLIHQMVIKVMDLVYVKLLGHGLNEYINCIICLAVTILCAELYKLLDQKIKSKRRTS